MNVQYFIQIIKIQFSLKLQKSEEPGNSVYATILYQIVNFCYMVISKKQNMCYKNQLCKKTKNSCYTAVFQNLTTTFLWFNQCSYYYKTFAQLGNSALADTM